MTAIDTMKPRTNPAGNPSIPNTAQRQQQSRPSGAGSASHESIARRAYEIWERKGRPDGQCQQNWQEAEAELRRS
jgi:hypothetical protein